MERFWLLIIALIPSLSEAFHSCIRKANPHQFRVDRVALLTRHWRRNCNARGCYGHINSFSSPLARCVIGGMEECLHPQSDVVSPSSITFPISYAYISMISIITRRMNQPFPLLGLTSRSSTPLNGPPIAWDFLKQGLDFDGLVLAFTISAHNWTEFAKRAVDIRGQPQKSETLRGSQRHAQSIIYHHTRGPP